MSLVHEYMCNTAKYLQFNFVASLMVVVVVVVVAAVASPVVAATVASPVTVVVAVVSSVMVAAVATLVVVVVEVVFRLVGPLVQYSLFPPLYVVKKKQERALGISPFGRPPLSCTI